MKLIFCGAKLGSNMKINSKELKLIKSYSHNKTNGTYEEFSKEDI